MPHKLHNCNHGHILVPEDDISDVTSSKLIFSSSLILINIALAFPLPVQACFLDFSKSFEPYKTIAGYISNISMLQP